MGRSRQPRVVICVHGVGPQRRDFDTLAEALASTHRVISVDMPGRGESEWLADPQRLRVPHVSDDVDRADCAKRRRGRRLGRHVDGRSARHHDGRAIRHARSRGSSSTTSDRRSKPAALERIRGYFGTRPDVRDATMKSRNTCARSRRRSARSTDAQWDHMTAPTSGSVPTAAGASPTIRASPFRSGRTPRRRPISGRSGIAIRCPTLVLRGAQSDLLSAATAAEMSARGPRPARHGNRGRRPRTDAAVRRPDGARGPLPRATEGARETWRRSRGRDAIPGKSVRVAAHKRGIAYNRLATR